MRRMFAGGRVLTHRRLRIGEPARRTSRVLNDVEKQGRSGPLRFLTVRHELSQGGEVAIVDDQDIVYRLRGSALATASSQDLPDRTPSLELDVDERLLFRFSALTYNAHRIHYDRGWCQLEGYDGLVVHGPLQALMMGELMRRNGASLIGAKFEYRLVAPMIGSQRMHVLAAEEGITHGAEVHSADGQTTATSTVALMPGSVGMAPTA
jgi:3-methylfumaryl-CoA hydratase